MGASASLILTSLKDLMGKGEQQEQWGASALSLAWVRSGSAPGFSSELGKESLERRKPRGCPDQPGGCSKASAVSGEALVSLWLMTVVQ